MRVIFACTWLRLLVRGKIIRRWDLADGVGLSPHELGWIVGLWLGGDSEKGPGFTIDMVGDAESLERLKKLAQKMALEVIIPPRRAP